MPVVDTIAPVVVVTCVVVLKATDCVVRVCVVKTTLTCVEIPVKVNVVKESDTNVPVVNVV